MKRFVYFEHQDGGMGVHSVVDAAKLTNLYSWMKDDCIDIDTKMLNWSRTADVGEMFEHRLGNLVRLKDADCHTEDSE